MTKTDVIIEEGKEIISLEKNILDLTYTLVVLTSILVLLAIPPALHYAILVFKMI